MTTMVQIDCGGKTTREINQELRQLIAEGCREILVSSPRARHNLAVALGDSVELHFDGSVGSYCGGMMDGPTIRIEGSAGWGLAECMLSGLVTVTGNVGSGAAASIRGGTVVVRGNAGARAGIAMKGGLLIVEGDVGYMSGFMMQKGILVICGNSADALADSMYAGTIFLGNQARSLGNDTKVEEPSAGEWNWLNQVLTQHGISPERPFKKIVSARRLWNFEKREFHLWKDVL